MTTKVRITHLDSVHPVKILVKDGSGNVIETHAIAGRGDEFELYIYQEKTIEVVEGEMAPVKVEGDGLQTKGEEHAASATPTHVKPK